MTKPRSSNLDKFEYRKMFAEIYLKNKVDPVGVMTQFKILLIMLFAGEGKVTGITREDIFINRFIEILSKLFAEFLAENDKIWRDYENAEPRSKEALYND